MALPGVVSIYGFADAGVHVNELRAKVVSVGAISRGMLVAFDFAGTNAINTLAGSVTSTFTLATAPVANYRLGTRPTIIGVALAGAANGDVVEVQIVGRCKALVKHTAGGTVNAGDVLTIRSDEALRVLGANPIAAGEVIAGMIAKDGTVLAMAAVGGELVDVWINGLTFMHARAV